MSNCIFCGRLLTRQNSNYKSPICKNCELTNLNEAKNDKKTKKKSRRNTDR